MCDIQENKCYIPITVTFTKTLMNFFPFLFIFYEAKQYAQSVRLEFPKFWPLQAGKKMLHDIWLCAVVSELICINADFKCGKDKQM